MTTETPVSTVSTDEPVAATPISVTSSEAAAAAQPTDNDEARRREEQWRIPQLLTALVTPILGLISVIFNMGGSNTYANIAGVLAIVTGAAAALIAGEVWRLHRAAHRQPRRPRPRAVQAGNQSAGASPRWTPASSSALGG